MEFTKKTIECAESVALRLKHAREMHELSVAHVADTLKMNKEHIEMIECGQFDRLPFAFIYQKKLIGNFAEAVGLEKFTLMKQFEIEQNKHTVDPKQPLHTRKKLSGSFFNLPHIFQGASISLFVLLFLGYLGYQVKQIVNPPELTLASPLDGTITKEQTIDVKGKTEKEVSVLINGKEVKHDEQGVFNEPITLTQGVNTIIISATTKHNKSTTITRYVVSQRDAQFSLSNQTQNPN